MWPRDNCPLPPGCHPPLPLTVGNDNHDNGDDEDCEDDEDEDDNEDDEDEDEDDDNRLFIENCQHQGA